MTGRIEDTASYLARQAQIESGATVSNITFDPVLNAPCPNCCESCTDDSVTMIEGWCPKCDYAFNDNLDAGCDENGLLTQDVYDNPFKYGEIS